MWRYLNEPQTEPHATLCNHAAPGGKNVPGSFTMMRQSCANGSTKSRFEVKDVPSPYPMPWTDESVRLSLSEESKGSRIDLIVDWTIEQTQLGQYF